MAEAMPAGGRATAVTNAPLLTLDSDELAREYERVSADRQFRSGQRLVEALAVSAGERVLDVGCGTGLLARHIADRVGPAGYVLGIDPLPLRIELAQVKARPGLEFRVGNAYALDFLSDGVFDVACLNAVLHWLPEKTGPLRQLARVLRPGGRLGIGTGLKDHRTILQKVVAEVLKEPPFSDHPRAQASVTFRVDPQELRELLDSAGFATVKIEVQDSVNLHPTAEAMIRYSEASSFGNFLGHLPDHLRPMAREAVRRRLEAVATPEGIRQEGRRIAAIATRS